MTQLHTWSPGDLVHSADLNGDFAAVEADAQAGITAAATAETAATAATTAATAATAAAAAATAAAAAGGGGAQYSRPAASAFTLVNGDAYTSVVDHANGPITLITTPENWQTTSLIFLAHNQALPSGSWRLEANLSLGGLAIAGGIPGLYCTNGTEITNIGIDPGSNGSPICLVNNWSNSSTYYAQAGLQPVLCGGNAWFAVEYNGTVYEYQYSQNGIDWTTIATSTPAQWPGISTPWTQIGFGADTYSGPSDSGTQYQPRVTSLNVWRFVTPT